LEITISLTPMSPLPVSSVPAVDGDDIERYSSIRLKESAMFRPMVKRDPRDEKMWVLLDSFGEQSHEWQQRQEAGAGRSGQQLTMAGRANGKEQHMDLSIDSNDRITVLAEGHEAPEGGERFQSEQQLATLTAAWPIRRLIAIWNHLPGVSPVKKFTDRKTAVKRIWKAVQSLVPTATGRGAMPARKKAQTAKRPSSKQPKTSLPETKTAVIIELLKQSSGASLKALMSATGWQSHSVRGFISGHLSKRLGFRVKSFRRDGERCYAIRA
jgi:hypothetical protein